MHPIFVFQITSQSDKWSDEIYLTAPDSDLVTAVGWTQTNVLYSCSDDKTILAWNIDGEMQSKVCDIEICATDFHWLTAPGAAESEVFGLASSDGKCFSFQLSKREKNVWSLRLDRFCSHEFL
jgi:WD40 repeat protein